MIIGVTGKYCAGKNEVGRILKNKGMYQIDVDTLGHEVLEKEKEQIICRFGRQVLTPDGVVDRRSLGEIVFKDRNALNDLEEILHPGMVKRTEELIREHREGGGVVNAAVLFKMGLHRLCDRVFWVQAPLILRIRRGRKRDGLSYPAIIRRIWTQKALNPNKWKDVVDIYRVDNLGSPSRLEKTVMSLLS